jgi:hypothetical protein
MKHTLIKFILIFIASLLATETFEWVMQKFFNLDFRFLDLGWFGLMIFYGFKYHIVCCLVPAIWAGYKCTHKSCEHEYCHDKK